MHLLGSLSAILAWTLGHQLWLSCLTAQKLAPPGAYLSLAWEGEDLPLADVGQLADALRLRLLPPFWT